MPKLKYGNGLAEKIRAERKKKGYSQQHLALRASVSKRELGRIERGDANPSIDTIFKLTEALGITLAELTEGDCNQDLVVIEGKLTLLIEQCNRKEKSFILGLVQYVTENIKDLES